MRPWQRTDLLNGSGELVLVDVDDSIIEAHGHAKQGASFGYTRVLGLNMLLATASTRSAAVVVVEQRLRKGACGSPRAAKRLVADALNPSGRYDPTGPLARCGRTPPSTEAGQTQTRTRRKRG